MRKVPPIIFIPDFKKEKEGLLTYHTNGYSYFLEWQDGMWFARFVGDGKEETFGPTKAANEAYQVLLKYIVVQIENDKAGYFESCIQKAEMFKQDAKILHENGCYTSAVNRAYYAIETIIKSLFLDEGVKLKISGSHKGAFRHFYFQFVAPNAPYLEQSEFTKEDSSRLQTFHNMRISCDYGDFEANSEDSAMMIEMIDYYMQKARNTFQNIMETKKGI